MPRLDVCRNRRGCGGVFYRPIIALSAAFNAALRQGHISVNPCAGIESLNDKATRKKIFTPEQVSALISAAEGDWKGVIMVGFYCGMRLNDACNLRWRDFDLVSPIKTITYEPRKTGEAVTVAVHPALEDYLLGLPAPDNDDAFVFPAVAQRKNVSPLSKAFCKIMQRARISQNVIGNRNQSGALCLFPLIPLAAAFVLDNSRQQQRLRRSEDALNRPYNAERASEIHASRP
jgi:site-specific recombinase XerC